MKLRLEDKRKAIELRIKGKTFSEIRSIILNLPKSTLSGWLKDVKLTKKQRKLLLKNIKRVTYNARVKAGWTRRIKNEARTRDFISKAEKEFASFSKNSLALIGIVLYWAEGGRKSSYFQFTNSDPVIIKTIMKWLREFCKIAEEKMKIRIYIHKIYAHEKCENFWSKVTGIPISHFQRTIYKPTPHRIKKNLDYKGCVQIRVLNTEFFRKIVGWQRGMINYFHLG